jgi:hypothetical protein
MSLVVAAIRQKFPPVLAKKKIAAPEANDNASKAKGRSVRQFAAGQDLVDALTISTAVLIAAHPTEACA